MGQIKDEFEKVMRRKTFAQVFVAPILIALLFSWLFSSNQILKSPITVIDLDNSMYSRQLIDKLDASLYVDVARVMNEPIEPALILTHDSTCAVVVLPKGLEENRYRGKSSNIGFVVNDSVAAAVGNLRQGVAEVLAGENASLLMSKLLGMGLSSEQAQGVAGSLSVQQRSLYNPTSATVNTTVIGFVNLIILALFVRQTAQIVPRLRIEGRFDEDIISPLALFCRIIPHVLLFLASMLFTLGLLKQFGGLRFGGSVAALLLPLFLYLLASGFFTMLLSLPVKDPGGTLPQLAAVVGPSFFFSNILLPVALMPRLIQIIAMAFPLNWYTKCYQAVALRGAGFAVLGQELGMLMILLAVFLLLMVLMIGLEKRSASV
ncbi:MAG: ABC transporter permease [Clostridiales bacterium]|nr:ABC transporter permease [Clostridiales bacterium]